MLDILKTSFCMENNNKLFLIRYALKHMDTSLNCLFEPLETGVHQNYCRLYLLPQKSTNLDIFHLLESILNIFLYLMVLHYSFCNDKDYLPFEIYVSILEEMSISSMYYSMMKSISKSSHTSQSSFPLPNSVSYLETHPHTLQ